MWNLIVSSLKSFWPMLLIFVIVLITVRIAYLLNHHEKFCFYKELMSLVFLIYILLLFQLLTTTEINKNGGMNLIPFTEITRYEFGSKMFLYNVFGNILIFIPFGYFISNYVKAKKIFPMFVVSTIVSASVEFIQHEIGRSFDIDDIILNVLGGILGYLLYVGLCAIKRHLPKFLQRDAFYNFLCILAITLLVLYYFGIIKLGGFL